MGHSKGGSGINSIATALGAGISSFANYSAKAASNANGVSAAAQSAQGAFNQNSANIANSLASDRIAEQYQFNAAQAAAANNFTQQMWQQSADWNEMMWQKSADWNAEQAQINRDWQERMLNTQYQRAVTDMEKAGLNPILAATHGINTGVSGGSAASISNPTISGASGYAASGGLMNGISASEGNYTGQMQYMGGLLGLLSAGLSGISSALSAFGGLGEAGTAIANAISDVFKDSNNPTKTMNKSLSNGFQNVLKNSFQPTGKGAYGLYQRIKNNKNR